MKEILAVILLGFTVPVSGQLAAGSAGNTTPNYSASNVSGLPASVNQATLTNLVSGPVIVDCRFSQNQGLMFSFNNFANEAAPAAVRLTFARSLDQVTFDTTNKITWDITSAGTNTARAFTNLDVSGLGFLQLTSISNSIASGSYITNLVLQLSNKRSAP
jgi:hypothetical protein